MIRPLRPAVSAAVCLVLTSALLGSAAAQSQPVSPPPAPLSAALPATQPTPSAQPSPSAQPTPAAGPLGRDRLQSATFVILTPVIQGNFSLVGGSDQAAIVAAMMRDSAGALKRHYPNAKFASDPALPGAVRVTPQMLAPSALVPWANIGARWIIQAQGAPDLILQQNFSLWTVYLHRAEAANFVFDQLAQRLP